jgi:hypothetical protein
MHEMFVIWCDILTLGVNRDRDTAATALVEMIAEDLSDPLRYLHAYKNWYHHGFDSSDWYSCRCICDTLITPRAWQQADSSLRHKGEETRAQSWDQTTPIHHPLTFAFLCFQIFGCATPQLLHPIVPRSHPALLFACEVGIADTRAGTVFITQVVWARKGKKQTFEELCSGGPTIVSSENQRPRVVKLSARMDGQQILWHNIEPRTEAQKIRGRCTMDLGLA